MKLRTADDALREECKIRAQPPACAPLLLSGPKSSAGRPMADGEQPKPGGWNRIHFIVDDLKAEVARLRVAGVHFRNEIVTGPGGSQILLQDPSGNFIELFEPARPR
jgi:predicted enzyme related to lactoylglutathione lyase